MNSHPRYLQQVPRHTMLLRRARKPTIINRQKNGQSASTTKALELYRGFKVLMDSRVYLEGRSPDARIISPPFVKRPFQVNNIQIFRITFRKLPKSKESSWHNMFSVARYSTCSSFSPLECKRANTQYEPFHIRARKFVTASLSLFPPPLKNPTYAYLISNSPHRQPYKQYESSSENLVLDQ